MNFIDLSKNREQKAADAAEEEALANYKPESQVGTWWVRKERDFTLSTKYTSNNAAVFQQKKAPLVNDRYAGEIKKEVPLPDVQDTVIAITKSSLAYELPEEVIWYGDTELPEGSSHFILVESTSGWKIIPRGFTGMGPANKMVKVLRELYPHLVVITKPKHKYTAASVQPIENMPKSKKSTPSITLRELIARFGDMDIKDLGLKINYNILENEND